MISARHERSGVETLGADQGDLRPDLRTHFRRGVSVSGVAYLVRQLLEFATSIALARLLVPADFGVVAIAGAFLQFSYVVGNVGMGIAVVQAPKLDRMLVGTALTVSLAGATLLAFFFLVASPWAAVFFEMPMLRLAIPVMSAPIILNSIAAIPVALLQREFRFGAMAGVQLASATASGVVGITLALWGHGAWSLVWATVASSTASLLVACSLSGGPIWPRFSRTAARGVLSFGTGLTFKNILVQIGRSGDSLVIGKLLGEVATGLYTRAIMLARLPQTQLGFVLHSVAFPVLSRLQTEQSRFTRCYVEMTETIALLVTPILFGLAVMGDEAVRGLFGPNWAAAGRPLEILSVGALLTSLHMLTGAAVEASGRVRYEVVALLLQTSLVPVAAGVGAIYGGIMGVSIGVAGLGGLLFGLRGWVLRATIGLSWVDYFGAIRRPLLCGVIMAVGVAIANRLVPTWWGPWQRLGTMVPLGAVLYGASTWFVARDRLEALVEEIQAQFIRPVRRQAA
ncbi:MAG TPA: lipopolysaccharide biosynthesis protein [Myxococcaceae bacterium]|nr:lipopolysaccharide biosynthesis protein [Myxococcaceae bacterium]